MRSAFKVAALVGWLGAATVAAAQPRLPANVPQSTPATPEASSAGLVSDELRLRLEALEPGTPEAYFALGEDVAAVAADPAGLELARTLFVLAYSLDRARGGQRLAAACCLALADISPAARDRRWLWSLASALDRRHARPDWVRRSQDQYSTEAGLRAANVLGLFRSGDGRAALELLKEPGVRGLLTSYERALSSGADTGALRTLEREAERWPCPECHNQRIVKKSGLNKDVQYKLCGNCNGNPGPKLSTQDLLAQLRLEWALLRGIQRSWAAQSATDLGAPLRDPDPEELPRVMGIDASKVLYRDGAWVAIHGPPTPEAAKEPVAPPPPPASAPAANSADQS